MSNRVLSAASALLLLELFGCAEGTLPPAFDCAATSTCDSLGSEAGSGGTGGSGGGLGSGDSAAGALALGGAATNPGKSQAMGGVSGGSAGSAAGGKAGTGGNAGAAGSGGGGTAGSVAVGGGGPSAPTDLTIGKLASADSEEAGNPAQRGNDGNAGTRWCAADAELGHHWTVDLGQPHELASVEIMFEFDGREYGYVVEGSLDDDDYSTLLDRTENTKQTQPQTGPLSASARYVRVRFATLPLDTWASFFELKVLGK